MAEREKVARGSAVGGIMCRIYEKRMAEESVFPRAPEAGEEFSGNCQGLKLDALAFGKPKAGQEADAFEAAEGAMERLCRNRLREERVFPHALEALDGVEGNCQGLKVSLKLSEEPEASEAACGKSADDIFAELCSRRRGEERVFPFNPGVESEFSGNCQGYRATGPSA